MTQPDSRHLVDPQLLPMLELLPTVAISAEILPAMRNRAPWFPVNPADMERTDLTIRTVPGPEGAPEVEVWIYRPRGAVQKAMTPIGKIMRKMEQRIAPGQSPRSTKSHFRLAE